MQTFRLSSIARVLLAVAFYCFCSFARAEENQLTLFEALNKDPNLSISAKLLNDHGQELFKLCQQVTPGNVVTFVVPSNDAWNKLPAGYRDQLLSEENANVTASAITIAISRKPVLSKCSINTFNGESLAGDDIRVDLESETVCSHKLATLLMKGCARIERWDCNLQDGILAVTNKVLVDIPFVYFVGSASKTENGVLQAEYALERVLFDTPIVGGAPKHIDGVSETNSEDSETSEESQTTDSSEESSDDTESTERRFPGFKKPRGGEYKEAKEPTAPKQEKTPTDKEEALEEDQVEKIFSAEE